MTTLKIRIVIFSIITLIAFPQIHQAQKATDQTPKKRAFGSSLERYKNKQYPNFQDKHYQNEQKKDKSDDSGVIRIKTDLVVNDILVTDQNDRIVTGLKKEDFIVRENGAPQTIEMFSEGEVSDVSRSLVLILDCDVQQAPYLISSIQAAKTLIDKLAPQDKMAIVTVDVKLRLDFTQDKTLLKKTLDSLLRKERVGI